MISIQDKITSRYKFEWQWNLTSMEVIILFQSEKKPTLFFVIRKQNLHYK